MTRRSQSKYKPPDGWKAPILHLSSRMPFGKYKGMIVETDMLPSGLASYLKFLDRKQWCVLDDDLWRRVEEDLSRASRDDNHDVGDYDIEQMMEDNDHFMAIYGYEKDWA